MKNKQRQLDIILIEDDNDHAEIIEFYIKEVSQHASVKHLDDGKDHAPSPKNGDGRRPGSRSNHPRFEDTEIRWARYPAKNKNHPSLKQIPVIIFSTSNACADREKALNNHANSFIVKPIEEYGFKEIIAPIIKYWELHEGMCGRQEDKP